MGSREGEQDKSCLMLPFRTREMFSGFARCCPAEEPAACPWAPGGPTGSNLAPELVVHAVRRAQPRRRRGAPEQRLPIDLPGAGLRQVGHELHDARVLVGQKAVLHVLPQPLSGRVATVRRIAQTHHRAKRHAPIRELVREDRAFAHVRMLVEAVLHLQRPYPLARNPDQIVGPTLEVVVAVPLDEPIAGVDPPAPHRLSRLLRLSPVARRGAVAPHVHHARLARPGRPPLRRHQLHLVPRHGGAGRAEAVIVDAIRQVDVQHLGRAEPFGGTVARERLPAGVDLLRKHLRG